MVLSLVKKLFSIQPPEYFIPAGVRVYAIGDIHGQAELLKAALIAIEKDAKNFKGVRIIQLFLGDYIDRGMHSKEVIELLTKAPPKGHERICLTGNHEATLLDFLDMPETIRKWSSFGGFTTLASYGVAIPRTLTGDDLTRLHDSFSKALPLKHKKFLDSLKLHHEIGDYFFVHAGINPYLSFDEQQEKDLLWIRNDFLDFKKLHAKYIIHGHTPVEAIGIRKNRTCLLYTSPSPRDRG